MVLGSVARLGSALLVLLLAACTAVQGTIDIAEYNQRYQSATTAGRYVEAEEVARAALAVSRETFGPDNAFEAIWMNNLAFALTYLARYDEAEALLRRSIKVAEQTFGPDHETTATSIHNLGSFLSGRERFAEAEPLLLRGLEMRKAALGPGDPSVAVSQNGLGLLYKNMGRYDEAVAANREALAIRRAALADDDPSISTSLNNLALVLDAQGREGEAEAMMIESIAIKERALGRNHPALAISLRHLASIYNGDGRSTEAEPLLDRALVIVKQTYGPEHPEVGGTLIGLGVVYDNAGREREAEQAYLEAVRLLEAGYGPGHSEVAIPLNNLALLYARQGRTREAEELQARSGAIRVASLGPDHPGVAIGLHNDGTLLTTQGRLDEAEQAFAKAIGIIERAYGPEHPLKANSLRGIAEVQFRRGDKPAALGTMRDVSAIHRARLLRGDNQRGGTERAQNSNRQIFIDHLQLVIEAITPRPTDALMNEALELIQLSNTTDVGQAVSRMAARFSAGDDRLAGLVRARQDALERWRKLEADQIAAIASAGSGRVDTGTIRADLEAEVAKLQRAQDQLATEFPDYAELTSRVPLTLADAQDLLRPREVLLSYVVGEYNTLAILVHRDGVHLRRITVSEADLARAVAKLRGALDPGAGVSLNALPEFDFQTAHRLYTQLIAPFEEELADAAHVLVVPDGALESLPFSVLVSEAVPAATGLARYRDAPWLAKRFAFTTLPSISSLRALRRFARQSAASKPFLGVGDPALDGATGSGRKIALSRLFSEQGIADTDLLRRAPSLPESADELRAIAATLGAAETSLVLGTEATETWVKSSPLSDYRVLAFATHGLVSGEIDGLAEPALLLTPPKTGTLRDDGLLTASEIAQLSLDADWVILSACNTAASDGTPGAEGLSGLAKAFFYSGSRSLLVSHWPVVSEAAVSLTTAMLSEAQKPGVGRAEAQRRSMMRMLDDTRRPYFAHPLFWAPFVVVGEGG